MLIAELYKCNLVLFSVFLFISLSLTSILKKLAQKQVIRTCLCL